MLVAAQQSIMDTKNFWKVADETIPNLPEGLRLISIVPSQDGKLCNFVWDCDSVGHMQRFMDKNWGEYSEGHCYEVDVNKSSGLLQ